MFGMTKKTDVVEVLCALSGDGVGVGRMSENEIKNGIWFSLSPNSNQMAACCFEIGPREGTCRDTIAGSSIVSTKSTLNGEGFFQRDGKEGVKVFIFSLYH